MTTKTKILPMHNIVPLSTVKKESFSKRIAIAFNSEIRLIEVDNIVYLKSDSNYTEIHLSDGSKIMASNTLKKYEVNLNANQFIRVHNSYIVQKSQITSYQPNVHRVILRNTIEIPVSRSKKELLISYLKSLMV